MRRQVGHTVVETIAAERSKFTAPMVLVHGLWCTSNIWHRVMGYLAHRGWDCHALNLRGRSSASKAQSQAVSPAAGLQECLQDLNAVIAECDAAPVLVGHDLGALLALSRDIARVRAVVAMAPILPASHSDRTAPGISDLRTRLAMKVFGRLPPPRGRVRHSYFGSTPPQPLVAESTALGRQLADPTLPFPLAASAPTLVVVGDADDVTGLSAISKTAHAIGAELQEVAGGSHALPWENGWQERVTDIHRWLIRTLGDSLLALLDEEEEG